MIRLKNTITGVIVHVTPVMADTLLTAGWVSADEPRRASRKRRKGGDADGEMARTERPDAV